MQVHKKDHLHGSAVNNEITVASCIRTAKYASDKNLCVLVYEPTIGRYMRPAPAKNATLIQETTVFEGQSWYESAEEPFDFEFESGAGLGAFICSCGAVFVATVLLVSLVSHLEPSLEQSTLIRKHAWKNLWGVAFMAGSLVCVIPFNQGNNCGQQGSNGVHIALICMLFFHITCSVCLSAFVAKQF